MTTSLPSTHGSLWTCAAGRLPPQITGLNPESNLTTGQPFLHWNATDRIANTAVEANVSRQSPAMVPVTHYYDVTRTAATAIDRLSSSRRSKSIGTNSSVCRSKRTAHAEMVNVAKELRARLAALER